MTDKTIASEAPVWLMKKKCFQTTLVQFEFEPDIQQRRE